MLTEMMDLLSLVYTETPAQTPADVGDDTGEEVPVDEEVPDEEAGQEEQRVPIADLRAVRAEAAKYRKQLRALEAKVDASTKAQEKATADAEIDKLAGIDKEQARTAQVAKELADANALVATKDAKITADAISTAVYMAANAVGFAFPEDVAAILDLSGIEVTDGEVDKDEINDLVKELAESKPSYLRSGKEEEQEFGGGASNPANKDGVPKVKLSGPDEIARMKQQATEAQSKGNMAQATKLYNLAWERERGIKPAEG